MLNGEWRLDYGTTSLSMGGQDPIANPFRLHGPIWHRSAPTRADVAITADDGDRPRMDGVAMGQDYHAGRLYSFDLGLQATSEAAVRDLEASVAAAWRADAVRSVPGALATLSTRNADREREVYGRPRRYVPDDSESKVGRMSVQCDFQALDDLYYETIDTGVALGFVSPPSTGVISPITSPVTTTVIATTPGAILVGGKLAVWPVVTIYGPIINPVVTLVNTWTLQLLTTLGVGQNVTIDTRPWRRSVLRSDGASLAGNLARGSRLSESAIPPGPYTISLTGIDSSGLSSMQFYWTHAYPSL